jgi:hypothetical protein
MRPVCCLRYCHLRNDNGADVLLKVVGVPGLREMMPLRRSSLTGRHHKHALSWSDVQPTPVL